MCSELATDPSPCRAFLPFSPFRGSTMLGSIRWLALTMLVATPLLAQAPAGSPGDRAKLLKHEDEWASALVKRDGAVFRRLLAAGFIYTEDDKLMTRDELLRLGAEMARLKASMARGLVGRLAGLVGA